MSHSTEQQKQKAAQTTRLPGSLLQTGLYYKKGGKPSKEGRKGEQSYLVSRRGKIMIIKISLLESTAKDELSET